MVGGGRRGLKVGGGEGSYIARDRLGGYLQVRRGSKEGRGGRRERGELYTGLLGGRGRRVVEGLVKALGCRC